MGQVLASVFVLTYTQGYSLKGEALVALMCRTHAVYGRQSGQ